MNQSLIITEIYPTIQGEARYAGWPCVMVRLSGCPLRCRWCDTAHSFEGGEKLSMDVIHGRITAFGIKHVEFTGGEPLAQPQVASLMQRLAGEDYTVMVETGGSEPIEILDQRVHIIMDLKCPDSGMVDRNRLENLKYLKATDEIKFVIASRADYEWAAAMVKDHKLDERFGVLFSSAFAQLPSKDLSAWMVEDRLPVKLNLQWHKYIWSPRAKQV